MPHDGNAQSNSFDLDGLEIAILIPCYNEEAAIGQVIGDFRDTLPYATVFVYDNNSTDKTVDVAREAGAIVRHETIQGKGNVVRRMFADIEADVYLMVDGDDTYHAASAPAMVNELLSKNLDMVNGARISDIEEAYRPGHRFGNKLLSTIVRKIFGDRIEDMLSGYRVFSRRFVKSFPALSEGFETETELTIHALELKMPISEVTTPYKERPEGSISKLNTFQDGYKILKMIVTLVREERPLQFFLLISALFFTAALFLIQPILVEYLQTGLVPRFPTAILSMGMVLMSFLMLSAGLILDTVSRGRKELKRLSYLAIPGPIRCVSGTKSLWKEETSLLKEQYERILATTGKKSSPKTQTDKKKKIV